MKPELLYLVYVTLFTGLLWVPYILNRMLVRGIVETAGYSDQPKPQSPWAQRLMKAHSNAIENLVVFGLLVLAANALGIANDATVTAAMVYFWARVLHAVAYTLAIPWVRTAGFIIGFGAQATFAVQILCH